MASPSQTNVQHVQQALQLRDIHLPAPIGWWPVAPGWYALMAIVVLVLCGVIYLLHLRKRQRVKREALQLLKDYELSYQQGMAVEVLCAQVSELLRRVSIYYYPRENIAGLQGEAWLRFLQDTSDVKPFSPFLLRAARKEGFQTRAACEHVWDTRSGRTRKKVENHVHVDVQQFRIWLLEKPYQSPPQLAVAVSQDEITAFLGFAKQWIKRRKHRV